jgi:hypothetical protein
MTRLIRRYARLDAGRVAALARCAGIGASMGASLLSLGLTVGVMTPLAGLMAPTEAVAQDRDRDADFSQFYDELEEYGRWKQHRDYGYVWLPNADDGTWRPYTKGHWINTEEHGWYWESEEPWGWATYHYGRWVRDDDDGWMWIPGRDWAPAWVAWRESENDEYIGWAPLPPEARWDQSELRFSSSFYDSPHYEPYWIFVRPIHMIDRGLYRNILPRSRSSFYLRNTKYSTSYRFVDQRIYNRGIGVNRIERAANRSLPAIRIVNTENRREHGYRDGDRGRGGGLSAGQVAAGVVVGAVALGAISVFRPKLAPRAAGSPPPAPRNFVSPRGGRDDRGSGRGGNDVRGGDGRGGRPSDNAARPAVSNQPSILRPPSTEGRPAQQSPPSQPSIMRPPSTEGRPAQQSTPSQPARPSSSEGRGQERIRSPQPAAAPPPAPRPSVAPPPPRPAAVAPPPARPQPPAAAPAPAAQKRPAGGDGKADGQRDGQRRRE